MKNQKVGREFSIFPVRASFAGRLCLQVVERSPSRPRDRTPSSVRGFIRQCRKYREPERRTSPWPPGSRKTGCRKEEWMITAALEERSGDRAQDAKWATYRLWCDMSPLMRAFTNFPFL